MIQNRVLICLHLSVVLMMLAACGGGGGSSNVTCASFAYQEDAQDHYEKKLDRDNDGVACEDLPHRPTAQVPPTQPTNPSIPSVPIVLETVSFIDTLARQPNVTVLSDQTSKFSVFAFDHPIGESYQQGATNISTGVTVLTPSGFSYFSANSSTYISYFSQGAYYSQGIAYRNQTAVGMPSIQGNHILIGRKCSSDNSDRCDLIYGVAHIDAIGNFEFCPMAEFSDNCLEKITTKFANLSSSNGNFTFDPSLNIFGGLTASSTPSNGVSINLAVNSVLYSLFGQPSSFTVPLVSGTYTVEYINGGGYAKTIFEASSLVSSPAVNGLSVDSRGTIFLRGAGGVLYVGVPQQAGVSASLDFQKIY